MITEQQITDARIYGNALVARLKGLGSEDASLKEMARGFPVVVLGSAEHLFMVYFRTGDTRKPTLRVCWDTEKKRENRPVAGNIAAVAEAVYAAATEYEQQCVWNLSGRARVNAAHETVEILRQQYDLVEDQGMIRIEETDFNSGRFDIVFKLGDPVKIAEVLQALRNAGLLLANSL